MFNIGDLVRVKEPFLESFPEIYTIIEIISNEDTTVVYILNKNAGGFDAIFLESVT